jgi:peptide/nickel transport system substrate-binding protein
MVNAHVVSLFLITAVLGSASCAPRPASSTRDSAQPGERAPQRALTLAIWREVTAVFPASNTSGGTDATLRLFNAGLTITDDLGTVHPELAEIPQLDTETWRILPDGQMETTYKLRPGLTWHDGQRLDAEDFVFAQRVSANSNAGISPTRTQRLMESVAAADPRALVIRWSATYAGASRLGLKDFAPLPRHLLAQPFGSLEQGLLITEAFLNLPYWRTEYIALGPYRLVAWEPGAYFEGLAFDAFARGRPKIDRIMHRVMDDRAGFTEILAGTLDVAEIDLEQAQALQRDWVGAGRGTFLQSLGNLKPKLVQLQPQYAGHPALLDVRVRKALAHLIDRHAINEGVYGGQGVITETQVPPNASFFPALDRAIVKHPYDPRLSERLMNDAGYTRDGNGFFADAAGGRFVFEFERLLQQDEEPIQLIMIDIWKRAGFEVLATIAPFSPTPEHQTKFPGIRALGGAPAEASLYSANLTTPQNRWAGANKSGFTNPEYDRLYEAFFSTLDQNDRTNQFVQMERIVTDQLPAFITHFQVNTTVVSAALRGPTTEIKNIGDLTPSTLRYFNIHEWEWK